MLKSTMEGTLEKPPANVLIYATSNRRHMMPERMSENLATSMVDGEIHPAEAIEDKLSLADRFGLSLSFRPMGKDTYLNIVDTLFKGRVQDSELLHQEALAFAITRGGQSGRTARHFFNHCYSA
jgi:predicted AAA+ superfamily ATPase